MNDTPELIDDAELLSLRFMAASDARFTDRVTYDRIKAQLLYALRRSPIGIGAAFSLGDHVRKIKGAQWAGRIVGTYGTALTPEGYAVESDTHAGSVQIYPAAALEKA